MSSFVDSTAFQRAAMRSERIRIGSILSVLALLEVILVVRVAVVGAPGDGRLLLYSSLLLVAVAVYESGMLLAVGRTIHRDGLLPRWTWSVNVVIETLLPTIALLILTESRLMGPYQALVAPAVLTYFFFITLATLRLSPPLAALTGLSSAIGYSLVVVYTLVRFPEPPAGTMPLGRGVYATYAAFLLVGGFVAAAVARQIRSHVGSALDEAKRKERFERDLEVARSIQQDLLPDAPPRIPGFDVAGWNRPADETGGDFYHWQPLENGCTGITVADVTGHGIGPAIIAGLARAYGRATLSDDANLANAMKRMDTLLSADLPSGRLVNLILALVDPGSGRVQLLSAGQGPILVYRAESDSVESSNADGVPLGVGLGPGWGTPREMRLAPGDMLVMVTDGFFEWENENGEQFGIDRLAETIRAAGGRPAGDIISTMHSEVLRFSGGTSQDDDLTAVIVKRGSEHHHQRPTEGQ